MSDSSSASDSRQDMSDIATLTMNPSLDASTRVDRVRPDDKLRCEEPVYEAGGGGLNVSRVVAELGGSSTAVYPAGGAAGRALKDMLEGLDWSPVPIDGSTRTNFTVTSKASNDQYRFVMPGPRLSDSECAACIDRIDALRPDLLVASGSLPPGVPDDFYARLTRRAADWDARVVVDTSGAALRHVADVGAFLLKPNVGELEALLQEPLGQQADVEAAADALVDDGAADILVLSLGSAGAYVTGRGLDPCHVRSPTVPIESRVGAGDSMVGGIVSALARGWDVLDAVRFGVAAGAAAVMTPGTQLARAVDVERLYAQMGEDAEAA